MVELSRYPEVVETAATNLEPHLIATVPARTRGRVSHVLQHASVSGRRRGPARCAPRAGASDAAGAGEWTGPAGHFRSGEHVMAARKGRQATRGGNGKSWPAWVWIAIGLLLGIGLMLRRARQGLGAAPAQEEPAATEPRRDRAASEANPPSPTRESRRKRRRRATISTRCSKRNGSRDSGCRAFRESEGRTAGENRAERDHADTGAGHDAELRRVVTSCRRARIRMRKARTRSRPSSRCSASSRRFSR